MKLLKILLLLIMFSSVYAYADSGRWLGPDRNKWPNTEYRQTKNDFGGFLLITTDLDWQQKWNTSPDTIPYFNEAKSVKVGERIVILTFFVNPKSNQANSVNVLCDLRVIRPDKSISVDQRGISCLNGALQGNPNNIRLSPAVIEFVGEEKDPLGKWVVEVGITDVVRNTKLNLRTSFLLKENNKNRNKNQRLPDEQK
jgi:hypothetical protein